MLLVDENPSIKQVTIALCFEHCSADFCSHYTLLPGTFENKSGAFHYAPELLTSIFRAKVLLQINFERERERDVNLETDEKAPIILESKVSQQFVGNLGPPGAVVLLEDVQQRGEGSEKTTLANRM